MTDIEPTTGYISYTDRSMNQLIRAFDGAELRQVPSGGSAEAFTCLAPSTALTVRRRQCATR